jgi:15-cis-phytoene synthase
VRDAVGHEARNITRSRARSFYLASLFLPASIRRDVHVVYAYYRTIDDLVDEPPPGWSPSSIARQLDWWDDGLFHRQAGELPLLTELQLVAERYAIPPAYLALVLQGARFDLECRRPETMDDLVEYSVLVAGSVGMVMCHILGSAEQSAIEAARDLGVAMQLTNVLRDVAEDLERGRVYLPRAEMEMAACDADVLHRRAVSPELRVVLERIMTLARSKYAVGQAGIPYLDSSVRFSIVLAATLYSRILDKIERQEYNVFAGRAHLGTVEKWALAMPAYIQHRSLARRWV